MPFALPPAVTGIIRSLAASAEPVLYPFIKIFDRGEKFIEKHRKEIKRFSCGCMMASGAVLPTLWPDSVGLRGPYQVAVVVFSFSTATFAWLKRSELAINGPYSLGGFSVVAILALLFSRLSLETFTPYVPFSLAVGILTTVYVVPKVRMVTPPWNRLLPGGIMLATDDTQSARSDRASVDPNSIRSRGVFHGNMDRFRLEPFPLGFAYMDHEEAHQMHRIPSSLGNISAGDLEVGLGHDNEPSIVLDESGDPLL